WLGMSLPPDEDWEDLTYTNGKKTFDSRFAWEVVDGPDLRALLRGAAEAGAPALGVDLKRMLLDKVQKIVFDPEAVQVEKEAKAQLNKPKGAARRAPIRADTSVFPDVFPRFGEVSTPSGRFGYIRLKSFAPAAEDVEGTVQEFCRIL